MLLVGVLGLQVLPVQLVYPTASAHHECAERGFCPRNPDGPCLCAHHGTEAGTHHAEAPDPDGLAPHASTMQACGGTTDAPLLVSGWVKGVVVSTRVVPMPPRTDRWAPPFHSLVPQRCGADIFRPPKAHLG